MKTTFILSSFERWKISSLSHDISENVDMKQCSNTLLAWTSVSGYINDLISSESPRQKTAAWKQFKDKISEWILLQDLIQFDVSKADLFSFQQWVKKHVLFSSFDQWAQ